MNIKIGMFIKMLTSLSMKIIFQLSDLKCLKLKS